MAEPKTDVVAAMKNAIPRRGGRHLLRTLSDAQLWEIFLRWRNGESTRSIARWIHGTLGRGSSPDSVKHTLQRFKPRIATLLVQIPKTDMSREISSPSVRQIDRLHQDGDLAEIIRLRDMSRTALREMLTDEAESGVTNPKIAQRQTSLAQLEKAVAKLREDHRRYPGEKGGLTADQKAHAALMFERVFNEPHVMEEAAYKFLEKVHEDVRSSDERVLLAAGMELVDFSRRFCDYLDHKYPEVVRKSPL